MCKSVGFVGLLEGAVDIWNAIPLCVRWIIWKERNCWTFEGIDQSMMAVKLVYLRTLCEWMVFE